MPPQRRRRYTLLHREVLRHEQSCREELNPAGPPMKHTLLRIPFILLFCAAASGFGAREADIWSLAEPASATRDPNDRRQSVWSLAEATAANRRRLQDSPVTYSPPPPPPSPPPPPPSPVQPSSVDPQARSYSSVLPSYNGVPCLDLTDAQKLEIRAKICSAVVDEAVHFGYPRSKAGCGNTLQCASTGTEALALLAQNVLAEVVNALNDPQTAAAIFKPYFPNDQVTTSNVSGAISVTECPALPNPPPPPPKAKPPPPPPPCNIVGTFQLVAAGRRACGAGREYLVYYGGNAHLCASNVTLLRRVGQFKDQRSLWRLQVNPKTSTTHVTTAGRACPGGENGLAGHRKASSLNVFLRGQMHSWKVVPVFGDCSLVNFIYTERANSGARAYLSTPTNCASKNPFFASKDYGTGRQRWRLVKV